MRLFMVLAALCAFAHGAVIHGPESRFDGRIIGGVDATIEEVPYQLALLVDGRQSCGASIISANWALTAAHCVGHDAKSLSLRAGSSVWNAGGSLHQVLQVIVHDLYNKNTFADFDYALLRVETPFPIGSPSTQAIPLACEAPAAESMALISGWGRDRYSRVSRLQKVQLPIVGRSACEAAYGPGAITASMLCAGWPEGGRNTCFGDSGGPLVLAGQQVGIVSWARGCAQPAFPTVYGNVAHARTWIRENTGV